METETLLRRLARRARPGAMLAAGLLTLAGMDAARGWLKGRALAAAAQRELLAPVAEEAAEAVAEQTAWRDMKAQDLERFKTGLPRLTESRRALYEGGLQLQEEMRLLSKQWEIVSTYLFIDEGEKKVHLMRGEQSLESYPMAFVPARAFGGEATVPQYPTPIVSKERFAAPERGRYEEADGKLQWEPPQVGTSARSSALGEFVMFTRGPLVLHGSPKKEAEHERFSHLCLGLSVGVARKLYAHGFIGTKIAVKPAPKAAKP